MGTIHTHATNKQLNDVSRQLARWAKKAKREYPQHLEDALRHAVDRLDPQALSEASAGVVATVTGNRKAAKRVRKSVAGTLSKVKMQHGTKPSRGHGVLFGLGAASVIVAACLTAMWRATRAIERSPKPAQRISADTSSNIVGVDPDLGPVPTR